MPDRDATLDAFITPDTETDEPSTDDAAKTDDETDAGGSPETAGETEPNEPADVPDASDGEGETEPVTERAETTFAWSPDGVACAACGSETKRRWRTDAGFVCHACVDWERTPER